MYETTVTYLSNKHKFVTPSFTAIYSHCSAIYNLSLCFTSLKFHMTGQVNTSDLSRSMSMAEQHYTPHSLDVWVHSDPSNRASGTASSCCWGKKWEHRPPTAAACFEQRLPASLPALSLWTPMHCCAFQLLPVCYLLNCS